MLRAAGDPSTPPKKLIMIYRATSLEFAISHLTSLVFGTSKILEPHEIPEKPFLEHKDRLRFVDALAANPSSPDEVLLGLKTNTKIVTNPRFLQMVAKEPDFLEHWVLLGLLQTTPFIPQNVLHLFTESPDARVRRVAALHVSVAGEADSNWRDEVGPILVRGCDRSLEHDFVERGHIIPHWICLHLAETPIVQEEEIVKWSKGCLQLFCSAMNTGGGWTMTFPWPYHLGSALSPQSTLNHWEIYANFGNRFVRAAARERLENL
jgi:hypothetical protein